MTLIFDSEVYTVREMRNRAFRRKITSEAIQAMYAAAGVIDPRFDMYDFQDDATLVGAINTGTSGFLGNMAWTHAGLRSGDGWYVPPQIPGALGFGMINNGGVSGYVGSCGSHSGNYLGATDKFTVIAIVKMVSTGEAGQGRIFQKDNNMDPGTLLYTFGTNQFEMDIGPGTAITTNNAFIPNYWHIVIVTFDGTQAFGSRCKIYVDGFDKTAGDSTDATITDDGNIMYYLDNFANTRAFNGTLGLFAICPEIALSQAQAQSLIELKGLFQPTAANQPTIPPGQPVYSFDGAASPNSDYFLTFQNYPVLTQSGTLVCWVNLRETAANYNTLIGTGIYNSAAANDEFFLSMAGSVASDPFEILYYLGGALQWWGRFGTTVPMAYMVGLTSDGSLVRTYINGNLMATTDVLGANAGQWFGDAPNANYLIAGIRHRSTGLQQQFKGDGSKYLFYDRALTQLEIQKIQYNGLNASGQPRWYPRS